MTDSILHAAERQIEQQLAVSRLTDAHLRVSPASEDVTTRRTVTCPERYLDTGVGILLVSFFPSCVTCCIVVATRPASSHALNEMSRDQISFSAAARGEPRLLSYRFCAQSMTDLPNVEF